MPVSVIFAENPVPYSHTAYTLYTFLDRIALSLCGYLEKHGHGGVLIPADVPYLYWDERNKRGQAILSMRHSANLAGLGILGRNTLLINPDLGNMVYIGAVLTDAKLEYDPMVTGFSCPPGCRICLDACPVKALDGITVNQHLCRENSSILNERNFDIYGCNNCRKYCPMLTGKNKKTKI